MTRALTQKSVASDLVFTRYVNAICNEGIRGLARFSAYLGLVYLLYGPFILRALYLAVSAWRNQRCASVRAFCAVGWFPHAPLSCFVLFIQWPSSHNLGCASHLVVSRSEINLNSREFYIRLNDSHGKEKWAYYKSWDGNHD